MGEEDLELAGQLNHDERRPPVRSHLDQVLPLSPTSDHCPTLAKFNRQVHVPEERRRRPAVAVPKH